MKANRVGILHTIKYRSGTNFMFQPVFKNDSQETIFVRSKDTFYIVNYYPDKDKYVCALTKSLNSIEFIYNESDPYQIKVKNIKEPIHICMGLLDGYSKETNKTTIERVLGKFKDTQIFDGPSGERG